MGNEDSRNVGDSMWNDIDGTLLVSVFNGLASRRLKSTVRRSYQFDPQFEL